MSRFFLLLQRQHRGAALTTLAPRSSICEKQQAALRASALAHQVNSALHTGKFYSFPLHIS
jgi:hypothetical protein